MSGLNCGECKKAAEPPSCGSTADTTEQEHPLPVLTVLQSDPLAYDDCAGNETALLPRLDLKEEEQYLRDKLQNADGPLCRLDFQIATAESIETVLQQKNPLLHLSCHGHAKYLFIENDHGGAQQLFVTNNLTAWISENKFLKCVFIAACQSRSAGQAFLDAGAKHVICCKNDTDELGDVAAKVFAASFYRHLFQKGNSSVPWGTRVKKAFQFARLSVLQCGEVAKAGLIAKDEIEKMCLLSSKTADENPLLPMASSNYTLRDVDSRLDALPRPPDHFVGRELDMYRIMKAMVVKKTRLVTITGQPGIGKTSLVKELAHYMQRRKMWGDILWCNEEEDQGEAGNVSNYLNKVVSLTSRFGRRNQEIQNHDEYKNLLKKTLTKLGGKKFVIIINLNATLRRLLGNKSEGIGRDRFLKQISHFIHDVLRRTAHVKFIVELPLDTALDPLAEKGVATATFELQELDFISSLILYGTHCQHSNGGGVIQDILSFFDRCKTLNSEALGDRVPGKTERKAKDEDKYQHFIERMAVSFLLHKMSPGADIPTLSNQSKTLPPVRTQSEVQVFFIPKIREEEKIYYKTVPIYARRAKRGEQIICLMVDGSKETTQTVADDKSWVIRGVECETYVVGREPFLELYNVDSKREISSTKDPYHSLRKAGFMEYSSKGAPAWVHQVDDDDMRYFLSDPHNPNPASTAYFMGPWGEPTIVNTGDYLVNKFKDEIYRVDGQIFERTHTAKNTDRKPCKRSYAAAFAAVLDIGREILGIR